MGNGTQVGIGESGSAEQLFRRIGAGGRGGRQSGVMKYSIMLPSSRTRKTGRFTKDCQCDLVKGVPGVSPACACGSCIPGTSFGLNLSSCPEGN